MIEYFVGVILFLIGTLVAVLPKRGAYEPLKPIQIIYLVILASVMFSYIGYSEVRNNKWEEKALVACGEMSMEYAYQTKDTFWCRQLVTEQDDVVVYNEFAFSKEQLRDEVRK